MLGESVFDNHNGKIKVHRKNKFYFDKKLQPYKGTHFFNEYSKATRLIIHTKKADFKEFLYFKVFFFKHITYHIITLSNKNKINVFLVKIAKETMVNLRLTWMIKFKRVKMMEITFSVFCGSRCVFANLKGFMALKSIVLWKKMCEMFLHAYESTQHRIFLFH